MIFKGLTEKAKNGLPKLPYSLLINKCFLRWQGFDRCPVYEGIKTPHPGPLEQFDQFDRCPVYEGIKTVVVRRLGRKGSV